MISPAFFQALKIIIERLEDSEIPWALTGSVNFALQGITITPNDIDLQCNQADIHALAEYFDNYATTPVDLKISEKIRSYFGQFEIEGVVVEIMAGMQKKDSAGNWLPPVDITQHRIFINTQGVEFPVLNLAYERDSYAAMDRIEKANRLAEWLHQKEEG